MKIEFLHASKFGNGMAVAAEFQREMATMGVDVDVHHIRDANASELAPADLYVFSSPGRMGKPQEAGRCPGGEISIPGCRPAPPGSRTRRDLLRSLPGE